RWLGARGERLQRVPPSTFFVGGGGGIRTHGTRVASGPPAYQAGPLRPLWLRPLSRGKGTLPRWGPADQVGPESPNSPRAITCFCRWPACGAGQPGGGARATGAPARARADQPRYSMAQLLRQVITAGAPPSLARLPMPPEEVAASYDDAEDDPAGGCDHEPDPDVHDPDPERVH